MPDVLTVLPAVADALAAGAPVVALESTLISHGLPRPENLDVARHIESLVRAAGATPATIAVVGGRACIGLTDSELELIAADPSIRKLSVRDLALSVAAGENGATTVSATAHLAALAGIGVFATGGLGGVHRGYAASFDESADLATLSKTPIAVVSAGVKSILDVPATLQRLETLGIAVIGYRTGQFPGFYRRDSGEAVDWRLDSAAQIARVMRARAELKVPGALLIANPIGEEHQLDDALHDSVMASALGEADRLGIHGQAITPFLLERMVAGTDGQSLTANLQAVYGNAELAAHIAAAVSASG